MSQFAHSIHVFNASTQETYEALVGVEALAAILGRSARAVALLGDWELPQPLSEALDAPVIEYIYAEDHCFELRLWHSGECLGTFFVDWDSQDFLPPEESDEATFIRYSPEEFAELLVANAVIAPHEAASTEGLLSRIALAASARALSEVGRAVEAAARGLDLFAYAWLNEQDIEGGLDELRARYPELMVVGMDRD
jgi:hypothetical protein